MNVQLDKDFQAVLEFMQEKLPTSKLVTIAERLPAMARLLWGHVQQEPFTAIALSVTKDYPSQSDAIGCDLAKQCAGGGSVVEADVQ